MSDELEAFLKKYSTQYPSDHNDDGNDGHSTSSSSSSSSRSPLSLSPSSSLPSSTTTTTTGSPSSTTRFLASMLSSSSPSTSLSSFSDYLTDLDISTMPTALAGGANDEAAFSYFDPRFPKSFSIVLLVVGIFGNLLCLFIFSRKNMRKNSTFIYLAWLAVVDLVVLTLGLGDIVLIAYLNFNMRTQMLAACRIISFLIYSFTHLSSFILASVSIDRAIATNFITFSKAYCRPVTAYKVIALNISLAVLINFHSLFFIGHVSPVPPASSSSFSSSAATPLSYQRTPGSLDENGTSIDYVGISSNRTQLYQSNQHESKLQDWTSQVLCESKKETLYDFFLDPYFKWIDLLAYAILPFIIMLICTFLIVRVLFRSNRRLNKNRSHQTTQSSLHNDTKSSTHGKDHHQAAASKSPLLSDHNTTTTTVNNNNNNNNSTSNNNSATIATTTTTTTANVVSGGGGPVTTQTVTTTKSNKSVASSTPSAAAASRSSKAKHLTYTLIILNCLFFCLVGPLLIVLCTMNDQTLENNKLLINIVYLLAYSNHSFNFVLYGVSSPPFRNELLKILGLKKVSAVTGAGVRGRVAGAGTGGGVGGGGGGGANRLANLAAAASSKQNT